MSSKVKTYFDTLAEDWEKRYSQRSDYRNRAEIFGGAISTAFAGQTVQSVLEIGCGAKSMFSTAQYPDTNYFATDFSYEMLKRNKEHGAFFQSDVLRMPVMQTFDLVILSSVIEWLDNPELVPAIVNKLVSKGGVLMVSYPNETSLLRYVENLFIRNLKKAMGREHYTSMQVSVKYATLESLFISEGFSLVKVYYFGKKLIANSRYSSSLRLDIYHKD